MKKVPKYCQGQSMEKFDIVHAKHARCIEEPYYECLQYLQVLRAVPYRQVTLFQVDFLFYFLTDINYVSLRLYPWLLVNYLMHK